MSEPLLTLEGVHTHIAQYHILQGVNLDVPKGGVTMLLGRNGAGKTTTLRTIMGLWQASQGKITFDGQDITRLSTPDISRLGISIVPENMGIFSGLTVEENMRLAVLSGKIADDRLDWIFSAFPPLRTFWKYPAGNLSGGQKQMLSVARAVAEERRLYLIDEPSKGLAPAIVSSLAKAIKDLKRDGATVLLVEQNFSFAKALGDTVSVMDDGHIVHSGSMAELAQDQNLQTRFMGLSMETA
ncbi:ABC transporter ATP-binding protein [Rhizobium sp. L1K21]|uniref:ABC transporter ATP-binding protein n=1 Tax=Rhizobium sp. L1K21 TaxID=2954933 RepID=UPI0020929814|nr:ABC transporter ATP-binding protein [Rhizobium sp. L1K21]MCO6188292.1 ABC transporter ATP-binding protein [Rhizobium sp. L1K21]